MAEIKLQGVWKKYGAVEAVKGIDFQCRDGELLSILGPSGCGKTSTLRMITGLEEISAGQILFDGKVVNKLSPKERDVAMAFEDYALYPALSVFDNIAFPLRAPHRAAQHTAEEIKRKVSELANVLDLGPILNQSVKKLSGGQQQRISLARALIRTASVYVLDEPLSHLDGRQQLEVRASLRRMQLLSKTTIILVTHNQAEAISMADRIVLMNNGLIEQVGSAEEIWNDPVSLFVADFIGDPPMNFIKARYDRDSRTFKANQTEIPVPKRLAQTAAGLGAETEFTIGIRPSDITVSKKQEAGSSLWGEVWVMEPMGDESIVTVARDELKLKALVPGDFRAEIGERVWLSPNVDLVHIFNKQTGKSLSRVVKKD